MERLAGSGVFNAEGSVDRLWNARVRVVMTARLGFGPRRSADPVLQFLR